MFNKCAILVMGVAASLCFNVATVEAAPEKAPEVAPDAAEPQFTQDVEGFKAAFGAQNWNKVIEIGNGLLATEADKPGIWKGLGVAYARVERYQEAYDHLVKSETLDPTDSEVKRNLAYLSIWLDKEDMEARAKPVLETEVEAQLAFQLAEALEKKNRVNEALRYFEMAATAEPKNFIYISSVSSRYFKLKDNASAEKWTQKGIEAGIKDPKAFINMSLACYRQKKYEDAVKWGRQGYEIREDTLLAYHIVRAENMLGHYAEAESFARKNLGGPFMRFELAKTLIMQACDAEQQKTCSVDAPDACCGRLKEAIQLFQDSEAECREDDKRQEYVTYYAFALILNDQLDAAYSLMRPVFKSVKTPEDALLASAYISMLWRSVPRNEKVAIRFFGSLGRETAFDDLNTVGAKLMIPSDIVRTLKEIQVAHQAALDKINNQGGKCGCSMMRESTSSWAAALLALAALVGLGVRRRRSREH